MQAIRDHLWLFISLLFGGVMLMVFAIAYEQQKNRKALALILFSNREKLPSVDLRGQSKEQTPGLVTGSVVDQPSLLTLKIVNFGNVPIEAGDYETPITISFRGSTEVRDVEIAETEPEILKARMKYVIRVSTQQVTLGSPYLRKQASVLLRVLVTHFSEEIDSIDLKETRIAGAELGHFKAQAEDAAIPRAGQKLRLVSLSSAILSAIAFIFAFPDIRVG